MAKQRIKEEVGSMEQDPAWPGNGEIRTPGRSIYLGNETFEVSRTFSPEQHQFSLKKKKKLNAGSVME